MDMSEGFDLENGSSLDNTLKLHQNIYGQKQAGQVWNKYLVDKLVNHVRFKQSQVDK